MRIRKETSWGARNLQNIFFLFDDMNFSFAEGLVRSTLLHANKFFLRLFPAAFRKKASEYRPRQLHWIMASPFENEKPRTTAFNRSMSPQMNSLFRLIKCN